MARPLTEDGTGYPERNLKSLGFQKDVSLISSPISHYLSTTILVVIFRFYLTKSVFVELKEKWYRQFEKPAVRLTSAKTGNCLYQKTLTKLHHLQLVNCGELQLTTLRISDDVNNCLQNLVYYPSVNRRRFIIIIFYFREFHKFVPKTRHSVKMLHSVHQSTNTRMRPNQGNNGSFKQSFVHTMYERT